VAVAVAVAVTPSLPVDQWKDSWKLALREIAEAHRLASGRERLKAYGVAHDTEESATSSQDRTGAKDDPKKRTVPPMSELYKECLRAGHVRDSADRKSCFKSESVASSLDCTGASGADASRSPAVVISQNQAASAPLYKADLSPSTFHPVSFSMIKPCRKYEEFVAVEPEAVEAAKAHGISRADAPRFQDPEWATPQIVEQVLKIAVRALHFTLSHSFLIQI
jgi:hypothetical protein